MKLAVTWPWSGDFVLTPFVDSVLNLERPLIYEVRWFRGTGWCNSRRRADACEKALKWWPDWIVQLDADQVYPEDLLIRLVKHMEAGRDLVSAMVPQRGYTEGCGMRPFQRLAWNLKEGTAIDLEPVEPQDGELQEVTLPTCAATIFRASDLRRLSRPWFRDQYDEKTWERQYAEDLHFIIHMRKSLGLKTFVDTGIEVSHLNLFKIDGSFSERFSDWSEEGKGDPSICRYGKRDTPPWKYVHV